MVRKATKEDFNEILNIYESARQYMKTTGNPEQWGDELPLASTTAVSYTHLAIPIARAAVSTCDAP